MYCYWSQKTLDFSFTVKIAKLSAMPRVNCSANETTCGCKQSPPQVTIPCYLREAFIVRFTGEFFKFKTMEGRLLLPSTEQLDQRNHLLPSKSTVNLSESIIFRKKLDCSLSVVPPFSRKNTARSKVLHSGQIDQELTVVIFCNFLDIFQVKKESVK